MATKDQCLPSKDENCFSQNGQYLNLNLNQTHQCFSNNLVQPKLVTNHTKTNSNSNYDFKTDSNGKNEFSSLWNKTTKSYDAFNLAIHNSDKKKKLQDQTKNSKSTVNNSTLSLHIAAYENSIIDSEISDGSTFDIGKSNCSKKLQNKTSFLTSSIIQNSFEFPRQQENKTIDPEISQFKASQKLYNPNEVIADDQNDNLLQSVYKFGNQLLSFPKVPQEDPNNNNKNVGIRVHHTDGLKGLAGTTVLSRYQLTEMFNCGGFGAIYRAKDVLNGSELIAKVEKFDSIMAQNEANVLLELNNTFLKKNAIVQEPIAKLYWFGTTEDFTVLLMEPLGPTVRDLKKSLIGDRFSMATSLWVTFKMIEAIKFVHQNGFIHADVKPSNFCIGHGMRFRQLFVIDFGVARKSNPNSRPYEARKTSFIGTARYASVMSQQGIDDGKLGDLWSIYFSTIENLLGQIPWRFEQNRTKIIQQKQKLQDLAISKAVVQHPWFSGYPLRGPPPSILYFLRMLQTNGSAGEDFDYASLSAALIYDLNMLGMEHRSLDWEAPFKDDHVTHFWNNPYLNKME